MLVAVTQTGRKVHRGYLGSSVSIGCGIGIADVIEVDPSDPRFSNGQWSACRTCFPGWLLE